jgi:hypothetical protein
MAGRRAAKVDSNQPDVVAKLRKIGFSVQPIHTIGGGVPDLLLGMSGWNFLIELKSSDKGKLTPDEIDWHANWKGQVDTAITVETILIIVLEQFRHISDNQSQATCWHLERVLDQEQEMAKLNGSNKSSNGGNRRAEGGRQIHYLSKSRRQT